jgi:uncharacterized protein (DUF1330 family)
MPHAPSARPTAHSTLGAIAAIAAREGSQGCERFLRAPLVAELNPVVPRERHWSVIRTTCSKPSRHPATSSRNRRSHTARIQKYGAKIHETLAPFNHQIIIAAGKTKSLEGEPPKSVVVIAFDSMENAQAWYDSPAYQAIKPTRQSAAEEPRVHHRRRGPQVITRFNSASVERLSEDKTPLRQA